MKTTLEDAKEKLQAVLDDEDSTDDEKKKAKRALANLDEQDRENKARAAWAALSPAEQAKRIEAAHAEQVSRSRLTAEEHEMLAKTGRRSQGTSRASSRGTALSMPQRPPSKEDAARRVVELDAEHGGSRR